MDEQIFYTSLDIRSIEPVDKRMYIDELTNANLTSLFGSNGQYGIVKSVVFNRTDNQFYYYSGAVPSPNILNPINWSVVSSSAVGRFVQWANDESYELGESVYDPNTIGTGVKFYIAKVANTTIGAAPFLTSSEWFEVNSASSVRQTAVVNVDTSLTTQTIQVAYQNISLPAVPTIQMLGKFGSVLKSIKAAYEVNTTTNMIDVTFTGDLSNSGLDSSVGNVTITVL